MNYLVYHAHGHIDFFNECIYSIHSFSNVKSDCTIVIYTDHQAYFENRLPEDLDIIFRNITIEEIEYWSGPQDFIHRVKIKILIDFVSGLEGCHNLLYVDTDTKFLSSIQAIFQSIDEGNFYMHVNEGGIRIGNQFRKLKRFTQSKNIQANLIPEAQSMWNAGVLGFKSTDKRLLENVLELTDTLYPEIPEHTIEQLALSIVFNQQEGRQLMEAKEFIFHYWDYKGFRVLLQEKIVPEISIDELRLSIDTIDPEVFSPQVKNKSKLGTLLKKWLQINKDGP